MRYFLIRTQLLFVSLILFLTFVLMMAIVTRSNHRWDMTEEKIFSLSEPTLQILKGMQGAPIEVRAFYPQEDPARKEFERFLKQVAQAHPRLKYNFYDPDRVPKMAKEQHIKDLYTIVIRFQDRQERIVRPTEESFANALLRLANPRVLDLCFTTGHDEASISHEDRSGYKMLRDVLEYNNYALHDLILSRDNVPLRCQVVVVAGPHRDLEPKEYEVLRRFFASGKGIFFLIDPMDPGTGQSFAHFLREFGITLGQDVIVDKVSRMVGGDFLVPLVNQYLTDHPVTKQFKMTTFFPVARTVQPSSEVTPGVEALPLLFTGSGSWAETDLASLERGEASFQAESDLSGPLPLAVAVQGLDAQNQPAGGRMIAVGDSDFLTNAYVNLSGNEDLALAMIHWLSKDERSVTIPPRFEKYAPLFMTAQQQVVVVGIAVAGIPGFFLLMGILKIYFRQKNA